ncbi:hypothetical protein [Streptomyces sp. CBMA29]|uniref:hypothetical protein n=1 Tax=Streptomyces sp. CBMA29 TaxID=1896314 RepID=UPI001661C1AA|nr:hypothetical protein [Streptomyces sp. CBMA29]MBD0735744.1 hypothetical protein [Streptomyces sp. CBMA29]
MKPAKDVLRDLVQRSTVSIDSSAKLVGRVDAVAEADDKAREQEQEDKDKDDGEEKLRRKPVLSSIPEKELARQIDVTPWELLHALGSSMALSRKGAGRGLAEHWGCLKYNQALTGNLDAFLALSAEGRDTAEYYKALQSRELGEGFGLLLTERLLGRRYPDHSVSIVPADTALRAGWALTSRDKGHRSGYRYRPQFFAEIWKPGEPSRVIPIACKGNHSNAAASHDQLVSASAHVEAVHIGTWNETPALIFSTELPIEGVLSVHALQAPGNGGWLRSKAGSPDTALNHQVQEDNIFPGIQPPTKGDETPDKEPGYHVQHDHYRWFQQVLARTAAAGLGAFAGDGDTVAQYLTKRQGRDRFTGFAHAAVGSVRDADHELLGNQFVGTDHVFRLNRTRVEAFSGVAEDLFAYLAKGQVEQYRTNAYARRTSLPRVDWDNNWGGPVSIRRDGSALAIRLLT